MSKFRPEWVGLGARSKRAKPAVIRVRDLPGFLGLEDALRLAPLRGPMSPELEDRVDELSRKTFGVTRAATEFVFPDEYEDYGPYDHERFEIECKADDHERQYETAQLDRDQRVQRLRELGFDFTNSSGQPLQSIDLFARQAEAVAKRRMGHMPDLAAASHERFASQIAAEAEAFLARKRKRG
jgi:hypothetical protein